MNWTFLRWGMLMMVLFCTTIAYSQEERNRPLQVVINDVKYTQKEQDTSLGSVLGGIAQAVASGSEYRSTTRHADYKDAVLAAVVNGISKTHRVRVVDGTDPTSDLTREQDFNMGVAISNISTSSRMETETVRERINGEYKERKVTKTYYNGMIGVSLQIKDVATGEIVNSPTFSVASTDYEKSKSTEEALSSAMKILSSRVRNYFNSKYPLSGRIIENATAKKDKLKEVYIDLGSENKVYKGMHFIVYTVRMIGNNEAREQIGKLKVTDVQGDNVSLCKVQSGGKEIKSATDEGKNVIAITTE